MKPRDRRTEHLGDAVILLAARSWLAQRGGVDPQNWQRATELMTCNATLEYIGFQLGLEPMGNSRKFAHAQAFEAAVGELFMHSGYVIAAAFYLDALDAHGDDFLPQGLKEMTS